MQIFEVRAIQTDDKSATAKILKENWESNNWSKLISLKKTK